MQNEQGEEHPPIEERIPDGDEMSVPTQDEFEKWTTELEEIEAQLAALNERKAMLQQVLETVPLIEKLRGNAPTIHGTAALVEEPDTVRAYGAVEDSPKLVNAIPMVLEKFRKPMTPGQIKKHLKDVGFTREFGETYFYTAIKRAVEKKAISKKRDGRYAFISRDTNGAAYGS